MTVQLLYQLITELKSEVRGINNRLRDLERAEQERKLARGEAEPITSRSVLAAAIGAAPDYYNGKPRQ